MSGCAASAQGKAGWRNCNLRTTFEKIVKRAGLTPWPRLFHNLRSSRQTELAERFPSHVVCDWLGNSEDIARKHYFQTTDDHFARALDPSADAKRDPKQQADDTPAVNPVVATEMARPKAKQNPKQLAAVSGRGESHPASQNRDCAGENDMRRYAATCQTDGEGFEPPVPFRLLQFSRLPP